MFFFKAFTLTCRPDRPYRARGYEPLSSLSSMLQSNGQSVKGVFLEVFSKIYKVPLTASSASYHADRAVRTEDDVLHLRRMPLFSGFLKPSESEALLQYLTAPYLRIPLVLDFFANEEHVYALQSSKLRAMLDAALFEPGECLAHDTDMHALPLEVPSTQPNLQSTRYGLLLNELVHCGPRLVDACVRLLSLSLTYDTFNVEDEMAAVIRFATRMAVRVEACVALLLDPDLLAMHDRQRLDAAEKQELLCCGGGLDPSTSA